MKILVEVYARGFKTKFLVHSNTTTGRIMEHIKQSMINAGYFSTEEYKNESFVNQTNTGIEYKIYLKNGDDYLVDVTLTEIEEIK